MKVHKFDLIKFSREIFISFTHEAKLNHIVYTFITSKEEVFVFGDREKLEMVLFNLLSNAFKFTPSNGCITVEINVLENLVVTQVSDTGSGVSNQARSKIFDRYYQDNTRHSTTGFGIGLFLVKKIIDAHHGVVDFQSDLGKGSKFTFGLLHGSTHFEPEEIIEDKSMLLSSKVLDVWDDHQALEVEQLANIQEEVDVQTLDITTEKKAILLVEDDDDIRIYIRKIFIDSYLIFEALDGTEGLALAETHMPDIIITDVIMSGGSGLDLCANIKNTPELSHIPVIILTSSSSSEIKLKGIEHGADDFITKPFEKDILIARVANLLKSRTKLQQYFFNEITLKSVDFKISNEYKLFLERCISITERHLDDSDFNIKTLADELATSPSVLYRKIKAISGKTTIEFIRYIRLRKAAQLLIDSEYNISQTAIHCGFTDIKYFREQFTKLFGMRPSDYVKKYKANLSLKHRVIRKS
ncbi:hybrid sensor histidine kinase/response regulator transcription factor [Pedobacter sp. P26]|uniref:hybrid sensor histidine kinase/response regulator transcription factor n=1 Tax=Pedobacter sp. P26 TaxID=3423956 RepID=UPI003D67AB34